MTSFGKSAPADELFAHFGFTVDSVVAAALGRIVLLYGVALVTSAIGLYFS